jgi:hypothetical protein
MSVQSQIRLYLVLQQKKCDPSRLLAFCNNYKVYQSLYMAGIVAPKRNVFLCNIFADPTIKIQHYFYPFSNINSKINTHLRPKILQKNTIELPHLSLSLLWHEFDNCLCNFLQCNVSCLLHMYTFFATSSQDHRAEKALASARILHHKLCGVNN